jgi:hypothetical protein
MKTFAYSERHALFPSTIMISYQMAWGGAFSDRHFWTGEIDGQVDDYGRKKQLIADAVRRNLPYVVLRVHRDGSASAVERG